MKKVFGACISILCTMLLFQNCSKQAFNRIDPMQKAQVLSTHMSESDSEDVKDGDSTPSTPSQPTGPTSPTIVPNKNLMVELEGVNGDKLGSGTPQYQSITGNDASSPKFRTDNPYINIDMWCRGANQGEALVDQTAAKLVVKQGSTILCQKDILSDVLAGKDADLSGCNLHTLAEGSKITISIRNASGTSLFFNRTEKGIAIPLLLKKAVSSAAVDSRCESYTGSPLVVDMRPKRELASLFSLSSPEQGEYFDILGRNASPKAHTKKLISIIEDARVMYLVLPNGKEAGIDQLFGDNTYGPDGKFAANGFAALAKYDGYSFASKKKSSPDGIISDDDEVYSKLRLWSDKNFNYKIDEGELITLREAKLAVIDLQFDADYFHADRHGNEYKYKSVVKLNSGELRPIFDIWYIIKENIQ